MLDVRSGRLLRDVSVLVRDGRIEQAVSDGQAIAAVDLPRYDLGDMTLLPGLIDMHVHLDVDPTCCGYSSEKQGQDQSSGGARLDAQSDSQGAWKLRAGHTSCPIGRHAAGLCSPT